MIWTERPTGVSSMLNDVTWTGSQFVAVGENGAIVTLPDAAARTIRNPARDTNLTLHAVAASNARIDAVGTRYDTSWEI